MCSPPDVHLVVDNTSDLERLIHAARLVPYADFPDEAKAELLRLLAQDHSARERIRFPGVRDV